MHRTTRMLGILIALQSSPHTLASLADRFQCSTKTIQRDLSALAELQIPVLTTNGYGGGVHLRSGWWLGSPNLNARELELLILALESTPPSDVRERLIEKLRGAIRPDQFDPVHQNPARPVARTQTDTVDSDMMSTLRKAIDRQTWLRVDYRGSSRHGERRVRPTALFVAEGHWYANVMDERSRAERHFRIDRIATAIPCLAPPDAADIDRAATGRPAYDDPGHPHVRAILTPAGVRFCQDHLHFRKGLIDDRLDFRCPPADLQYIAIELLRIGPDCHVIGPPELIEAIRARIQSLQDMLPT